MDFAIANCQVADLALWSRGLEKVTIKSGGTGSALFGHRFCIFIQNGSTMADFLRAAVAVTEVDGRGQYDF